MNPRNYNISIRRVLVDEDQLFEARIRELPDVTEYADTMEEAYELALDTIETTAEIFAEQGRAFPVPALVVEDYSGRITLRVPKSLHRRLALESDEEGISLNQYLVSLLAYHVGTRFGRKRLNAQEWHHAPREENHKTGRKTHLQLINCAEPQIENGYRKVEKTG